MSKCYNITFYGEVKLKLNRPILSICTRCRDGHEAEYDSTRGGTRLAASVLTRAKKSLDQPFDLRGVACMSQCKRPCISAVSASGCFSYIFGDLDTDNSEHIDALFEFMSLYIDAPEGFVERNNRPIALQKGILARLPPMISSSSLIVELNSTIVE